MPKTCNDIARCREITRMVLDKIAAMAKDEEWEQKDWQLMARILDILGNLLLKLDANEEAGEENGAQLSVADKTLLEHFLARQAEQAS